jgi:hypothetical protein
LGSTTKFSIFIFLLLPAFYTQNFLPKINKTTIWLRLDATFYTKKWTIDMQNDPGHHTPFFKPKYNIHELSDDIRICDFTCQPDLIFIGEKNKTNPSQSMQKLLKFAKKLRKKAHFSPMAKQPPLPSLTGKHRLNNSSVSCGIEIRIP